MKTLRNLGIDLLLAVLSPLLLAAGILCLPYLIYVWIKGIVAASKGHFPSGETRFDEKYTPEVRNATLDQEGPSLQVYSPTQNTTYNVGTVDNSTNIDSHDSRVVNNYYFNGQPQPREQGPLDTGVTFDPDAPANVLASSPDSLRGPEDLRGIADGSDIPQLGGYGSADDGDKEQGS